jgi:hypothetical protein
MFYPTVFSNKSNKTHIVKDKNVCNCGERYNFFSTFTRSDFKKIRFQHFNEITCQKCKSDIDTDAYQTYQPSSV